MKFSEVLENAPEQARDALELCKRVEGDFKNILISGLGGSGVVGSIVQEFLCERIDKPITVSKSALVPKFCDENTLHIVVSYSGNTKETLEAFEKSTGRKICITSGGALAEKCNDVIRVPEGLLPRQSLFYMLIPALGLFYDLPSEIPEWLEETKELRDGARIMAKRIGERTPLIYSSYPFSSLALRFKQQVNENCKTRAFCNYFPELNHNEIESFHNNFRDYVVISINGEEKSLNIMKERCDLLEMELYGKSDVEKLFKALYFIDFVTYYLAELKGVDPAAIPNIDLLKSHI